MYGRAVAEGTVAAGCRTMAQLLAEFVLMATPVVPVPWMPSLLTTLQNVPWLKLPITCTVPVALTHTPVPLVEVPSTELMQLPGPVFGPLTVTVPAEQSTTPVPVQMLLPWMVFVAPLPPLTLMFPLVVFSVTAAVAVLLVPLTGPATVRQLPVVTLTIPLVSWALSRVSVVPELVTLGWCRPSRTAWRSGYRRCRWSRCWRRVSWWPLSAARCRRWCHRLWRDNR